jgi:hypothetical protein
MPLSPLQRRVLAAIAAQRDPESYVAGGTALHRDGIRGSADIDLFHDGEEALDRAVAGDSATLVERGFALTWERRSPAMYRALVRDGGEATRLDWVVDSDFRFFPTLPDEEFGYILHPLDLATNKLLAAAGRAEPRDSVDVVWIDRHIQPLGAVAWAAAEKDPGWMPEGILGEVRRKARYQDYELETLILVEPLSAARLNQDLRAAVDRAERLVAALSRGLPYGAILRPDGALARPDPDRPETLEGLVVHHGSRKGAWPGSPEIGSVMLRERRGG